MKGPFGSRASVCALALTLVGCATADSGGMAARSVTAVDYQCVWQSDGGEVELGEIVSVTRGPDGQCDGLDLGSTQTFELRSIIAADDVKAAVDVAVAEDGSLSFDVQVPPELRIGRAQLQAIPADPHCDDPGVLDCPAPAANFDVTHPASALRDVKMVARGLATPQLPSRTADDQTNGYYRPGPEDGQLTLVLTGNGCETLPQFHVVDAPLNSLEIVSEVRGDSCPDISTQWTSIIEIPDKYAAFDSVKIDNVPAQPLPGE